MEITRYISTQSDSLKMASQLFSGKKIMGLKDMYRRVQLVQEARPSEKEVLHCRASIHVVTKSRLEKEEDFLEISSETEITKGDEMAEFYYRPAN